MASCSCCAHRSSRGALGNRLLFKWHHINHITQLHYIIALIGDNTNDVTASAVEDIVGKQEEGCCASHNIQIHGHHQMLA